jgi:hypothetical protein
VRIFYFLLIVLSLSFCPFPAIAADDQPRVLTNDDLSGRPRAENQKPADNPGAKKESRQKKIRPSKQAGDRDKERWCKDGSRYRNRVDEAKANFYEAEKKYSEARDRADSRFPKKKKQMLKAAVSDAAVRKARLKLEKAEKQLLDLEQDAHRKNVPPGWLQCRFSY